MEYRCWCRDCGAWAGQASGLAVSLYRDEVLAHNLIEASGRKRLPADVPSGAYALKAGDMLDHADAGGRLLSRLKYLGGYGRHQHPDLSLQERADRDFEGHLAAARREHGALLDLLRP
ncbi:hypothetical protein [Poseidonocella sp. HB161398]|uniref:hypothetical protein n=1 Tax=Poseidonocella sp. HB161398 TaxID=2320855 RepID=UPI001107F68B|nr:hypothetical protein [Poseidonocella sp. HB161398]